MAHVLIFVRSGDYRKDKVHLNLSISTDVINEPKTAESVPNKN